MATNASTWFYSEPEHNTYLIEERVNHTFWSNRIAAVYLDCTRAEPPFRVDGEWRGISIELEWVPNALLTLSSKTRDDLSLLIVGVKEILGFNPTISYIDPEGYQRVEWYVKDAESHIREIQGNPNYQNIKRYK